MSHSKLIMNISLSLILTAASMLSAAKAVADDSGPDSPVPVPCSSINPRLVALHTKCATSKGAVYERVYFEHYGEAWKGPDGLIWSDLVGNRDLYEDPRGGLYEETFGDMAVGQCEVVNGKLPSNEDFQRNEGWGFREVLPGMKKGEVIWTDSTFPNPHYLPNPTNVPLPGLHYIFDTATGNIAPGNGGVHRYRCITRW